MDPNLEGRLVQALEEAIALGYKPTRGITLSLTGVCCVLGAFSVVKLMGQWSLHEIGAHLGLTRLQSWALAAGWDDKDRNHFCPTAEELAEKGVTEYFELGKCLAERYVK